MSPEVGLTGVKGSQEESALNCQVEFPEMTKPLLDPPTSPLSPLALQFSRLAQTQRRPMLSLARSLLSHAGHTRYH